MAGLEPDGPAPSAVGHVNAHGASTLHDDQIEAHAIRATLGDAPGDGPEKLLRQPGRRPAERWRLAASVLALQKGSSRLR